MSSINEKKISVMLISPIAPPRGGLMTWTDEYLASMNNKGLNIEIVNTNYKGISQIIASDKRNFGFELKRSLRIWKDTFNASKKCPDIVHLCSPCSFFGCLRDIITLSIAKIRCKHAHFILHCHCNLNDYVGEKKKNKLAFKALLNLVDKVFVMNNQSVEYMRSIEFENVVNIPNCISERGNSSLIARESSKSILDVIFIGRQTFEKGIDVVIDVATKAKTNNDNIIFHIVGDDNEYMAQFTSLPKNIVIHGRKEHSETLSLLRNSDIMLFPSRTEGFPYVVLEAMMYGVPIIASRVGAIDDMLSGTGAIVIDNFEAECYYDSLQKMKDFEARRKVMTNERKRYEMMYTPEVVSERIINQYNELIRGNAI